MPTLSSLPLLCAKWHYFINNVSTTLLVFSLLPCQGSILFPNLMAN